MNELQRIQYLNEMGIETFVPRLLLANAPTPSVATLPCEEEFELGADSSAHSDLAANSSVTQPKTQPQYTSAAEVSTQESSLTSANSESLEKKPAETPMGLTGSAKSIESKAESKNSGPSSLKSLLEDLQKPKAKKGVYFSLSLWTLPCGLQVIDTRTGAEALPTEALLTNILRVTGFLPSTASLLPNTEIQNWPVSGANPDKNTWQDANEVLTDFLLARSERQEIKHYVLFGRDAFNAMLADTVSFEDSVNSFIELPNMQSKALVLPSLKNLLEDPSQKATLWQLLNKLISEAFS